MYAAVTHLPISLTRSAKGESGRNISMVTNSPNEKSGTLRASLRALGLKKARREGLDGSRGWEEDDPNDDDSRSCNAGKNVLSGEASTHLDFPRLRIASASFNAKRWDGLEVNCSANWSAGSILSLSILWMQWRSTSSCPTSLCDVTLTKTWSHGTFIITGPPCITMWSSSMIILSQYTYEYTPKHIHTNRICV